MKTMKNMALALCDEITDQLQMIKWFVGKSCRRRSNVEVCTGGRIKGACWCWIVIVILVALLIVMISTRGLCNSINNGRDY